jgi:hypothetical protein
MKVDEGALEDLSAPILRFKEIPSAAELVTLLDTFLAAENPRETSRS